MNVKWLSVCISNIIASYARHQTTTIFVLIMRRLLSPYQQHYRGSQPLELHARQWDEPSPNLVIIVTITIGSTTTSLNDFRALCRALCDPTLHRFNIRRKDQLDNIINISMSIVYSIKQCCMLKTKYFQCFHGFQGSTLESSALPHNTN